MHGDPIAYTDQSGLFISTTVGGLAIGAAIITTIVVGGLGTGLAWRGYVDGKISAGEATYLSFKWSLIALGSGLFAALSVVAGPRAKENPLTAIALAAAGYATLTGGRPLPGGVNTTAAGLNVFIHPLTQPKMQIASRASIISAEARANGLHPAVLASVLLAERKAVNVLDYVANQSPLPESVAELTNGLNSRNWDKHSIGFSQLRVDNMKRRGVAGWNAATPSPAVREVLLDDNASIAVTAEYLAMMLANASPATRARILRVMGGWSAASQSQRESVIRNFSHAKDTGDLDAFAPNPALPGAEAYKDLQPSVDTW